MTADTIIIRLRQIVRESADHLILADGPAHPDAELLDLCAEAADWLWRAREVNKERKEFLQKHEPHEVWFCSNDDIARMNGEQRRCVARAKAAMRRAGTIQATTSAGVFAKALLVRRSRTGAPILAKSLAADLISIPGLRASLWPAETEQAQ